VLGIETLAGVAKVRILNLSASVAVVPLTNVFVFLGSDPRKARV
jgi:hypothetical protein